PFVPRRSFVGAQDQLLPVGNMGKARPDLRSVDDKFIAFDPPARLDPGKVRPGARFRKALAPYRLAREDARQVIGFLLLARVEDQRRPAVIDPDEVRADPRRMGL